MQNFEDDIPLPSPLFGNTKLRVRMVQHDDVSDEDIQWLTTTLDETKVVGLDTEFKLHKVCLIQLSTASKCLLIKVKPPSGHITHEYRTEHKNEHLNTFFRSMDIIKTGAEIWQDAILLYHNFGYEFNATYDITKAFNTAGTRMKKGLFNIFKEIFPKTKFVKDKVTTTSDWAASHYTKEMIQYAAFDALVSYAIGCVGNILLLKTKPIQMLTLPQWASWMCADMTIISNVVEDNSGVIQKVDYSDLKAVGKKLWLRMDRFPTRIRSMHKVTAVFGNDIQIGAKILKIKGKSAWLAPLQCSQRELAVINEKGVSYIESDISNESSAESHMRNVSVSEILSLQSTVDGWTKIEGLYKYHTFNTKKRDQVEAGVLENPSGLTEYVRENLQELNDVQEQALVAILGSTREIEIIQGPPGTGKTTVITHSLDIFHRLFFTDENPTEIAICAARGNVAVRNIAQACLKLGFDRFRLIVSKEFYEEWHEPQYEKMTNYIITSDQIQNKEKMFKDIRQCSVILCTISMLHNEKFFKTILHNRSPSMLIVDEASQIHIGSYIAPLLRMPSLKKITFIGDDKQLPPYGSEKIKVHSIFDIYRPTYFLEIQYRLPRLIGEFISKHVYNGKLKNPDPTPLSNKASHPVLWVNVEGDEEFIGTSYQNEKEANQIVALALQFHEKNRQFVILVPYDRQRHVISSKLKHFNISPESTVFNIDSFQGQESDFVIVGVTRTASLGFLNNQRRTNVLLSRCKVAMIVVGNLDFITSCKAKDSLLGKLAKECKKLKVVVHAKKRG